MEAGCWRRNPKRGGARPWQWRLRPLAGQQVRQQGLWACTCAAAPIGPYDAALATARDDGLQPLARRCTAALGKSERGQSARSAQRRPAALSTKLVKYLCSCLPLAARCARTLFARPSSACPSPRRPRRCRWAHTARTATRAPPAFSQGIPRGAPCSPRSSAPYFRDASRAAPCRTPATTVLVDPIRAWCPNPARLLCAPRELLCHRPKVRKVRKAPKGRLPRAWTAAAPPHKSLP